MGKTDGFPMIPRILHYVWLGGKPLNELGERCLASWQKHLPGWQIKRWDETNSPMEHPYVKAMMNSGYWAFASDYIRLHALAAEGGVYLDTDVELLADISPILNTRAAACFLSMQNKVTKNDIGSGFMAAVPAHPWILAIKTSYQAKTRPQYAKNKACLDAHSFKKLQNTGPQEDHYDVGDIRIFHSDYFYPACKGRDKYLSTHRTLAIHHSTLDWGGAPEPLTWGQKISRLRLDRKIIRPVEQAIKRLLGRKKSA